MHYYEWNNLIGNLLFSPDRAGQPVLLYLTREQITQAAIKAGHFETANEAWECFARRTRGWFHQKNLIECINAALHSSHAITISGSRYETHYPVYLSLLVIAVLPLTDDSVEFVSAADYYSRAKEYLQKHSLPTIETQNADLNWNKAWQHLQDWSLTTKGGAWGCFRLNATFGLVYVGKPFSQCLLPPNALRDLPRAFVRAGWLPRQQLTQQDWLSLLINHCYDIGFRQAALKTLRTDEGLTYALPILQDRFRRWDGTTQTAAKLVDLSEPGQRLTRQARQQKDTTFARLYLSFPDPEQAKYRFEWTYRIRGAQPLPDTLHIFGQTFEAQLGDWSSEVELPFQEGLTGEDTLNKWAVKWLEKDIRLFCGGQWQGLSSSVWIETDELSKYAAMFAICKPTQVDQLRRWGQTFRPGDFTEWIPDDDFDATGWPVGYGAFEFKRPTQGIPNTAYGLNNELRLTWAGGLRIGYNEYLDSARPALCVLNGDESVQPVAFTENGQQISLTRRPDTPTLSDLDGDVPSNVPVNCWIEGQTDRLTVRLIKADVHGPADDWPTLPLRDALGNVKLTDNVPYAFQGLTVQGIPESRLHFMRNQKHLFFPANLPTNRPYQPTQNEWMPGDDLLTYLTARGECRVNDFFAAYETLLVKAAAQQRLTLPVNAGKARRWALGWYDTLGYVDYDYDLGRIRVLPPTFIPVPCSHGHRAMLVGGRSPELLAQIQQTAHEAGVTVCVRGQTESQYLAPSVISLYTRQPFNGKVHSPLQRVARQLGIPYWADELPAWRLLERSGSLQEYRATLQPESDADVGTWRLRIFNPDRLRFEPATGNVVDTSFTLTERQLNAYEKAYYLWIIGQSYRVDKNWGRFLVLHHRAQQVVFRREQHNQIAIPATLPLPRVLARGFALLSGLIPAKTKLRLDGTERDYLLYENAGNILSGNYIQKLGQQLQSTNL